MWPEILINRWPGHRPWVGTLRRACKNVSLCLGAGVSYQFGGGDLVTKSYPTFANPCSVACQAPLSMEFSKQEYWSGLSFPSPGDLPNPGIEPGSPALQVDSSLIGPTGKPIINVLPLNYKYILCYLLSSVKLYQHGTLGRPGGRRFPFLFECVCVYLYYSHNTKP